MHYFINSLAFFDLILFAIFFIGVNVIFYKLIKDILNTNKEKFFGIVSMLCINILFFALIYSNYQLFF